MPSINEKQFNITDVSGAVQRQTTRFLAKASQVKLAINMTFDRIGGARKCKGNTIVGTALSTTGNILALAGYNKSDGTTTKLVAQFGTDLYVWGGSSWAAASQSLTASTRGHMETFLDYLFYVNGTDANRTYNGTSWSTSTLLSDAPKASMIAKLDSRLYLGAPYIGSTQYKSRIWFCDLPVAQTITWGIETGSNLAQTASSAVVTSASSTFITNNIKVGNPFVITSGSNAGQYVVKSIDSETQITLDRTLSASQTDSTYWVGGNYFDVNTDDGDILVGIVSHAGELLCFKYDSLHRFNPRSLTRYQVKDVPGTTSIDSIVTLGDYAYYFHPNAGIMRYNQGAASTISLGVKDFIDGMSATNYVNVIGWKTGERYVQFYIGDVTLRDGTAITDCILKFDSYSDSWEVRQFPYAITAAGMWRDSNKLKNTYIGNENSAILQDEYGESYNTTPISYYIIYSNIMPKGKDASVTFTRNKLFLDKPDSLAMQARILYKRTKFGDSNPTWMNETDFIPMSGDSNSNAGEFSYPFNANMRGAGLDIIVSGSSSVEGPLIEGLTVYYDDPNTDPEDD